MMCPADTPEGEACGLVKNLALLAHVTDDEDDDTLKRICYDLAVEDVSLLTGGEINAVGTYLVFLNGLMIGVHANPQVLARQVGGMKVFMFCKLFSSPTHALTYCCTMYTIVDQSASS